MDLLCPEWPWERERSVRDQGRDHDRYKLPLYATNHALTLQLAALSLPSFISSSAGFAFSKSGYDLKLSFISDTGG